jgi:DNA-binding NarL/FixJ family response regulator
MSRYPRNPLREAKVIELLRQGTPNKHIAADTGCSVSHVCKIAIAHGYQRTYLTKVEQALIMHLRHQPNS